MFVCIPKYSVDSLLNGTGLSNSSQTNECFDDKENFSREVKRGNSLG